MFFPDTGFLKSGSPHAPCPGGEKSVVDLALPGHWSNGTSGSTWNMGSIQGAWAVERVLRVRASREVPDHGTFYGVPQGPQFGCSALRRAHDGNGGSGRSWPRFGIGCLQIMRIVSAGDRLDDESGVGHFGRSFRPHPRPLPLPWVRIGRNPSPRGFRRVQRRMNFRRRRWIRNSAASILSNHKPGRRPRPNAAPEVRRRRPSRSFRLQNGEL